MKNNKNNSLMDYIMVIVFFVMFTIPTFGTPIFSYVFGVSLLASIIMIATTYRANSKTKVSLGKKLPNYKNVTEATIETEYLKKEDRLLKGFIKEELQKNNFINGSTINYVEKRKMILTGIFAVLNIIFISFYFFHLPTWTYIFFVVNIIVFLIFTGRFNLVHYLIKQVKGRPDEDLSNVVVSSIQDKTTNKFVYRISIIVVSLALPLFLYSKPRIFYEKTGDGYYVRFYTIGLKNNEVAEIPETYKGKRVIGIRGKVFANIKSLKEVKLPNSIETIRGQAFMNDINLERINLPSNLNYLGGSAFQNCKKLENISIPKGVTEIHGKAFKGCSNLKSVELPDGIIEIHGNSFENCVSLQSINIPDSVKRIGGHAFYGDSSLVDVIFTENSQIDEIGSSAFRRCSNLREITLPNRYIYINERAFKESPTVVNRFDYTTSYNQSDKYTVNSDGTNSYIEGSNFENEYSKLIDRTITRGEKVTLENGATISLSSMSETSICIDYYLEITDTKGIRKIIKISRGDNNKAMDDLAFKVLPESNKDSLEIRIYYN